MGHRSPEVVHNKALVLKKEAERFWGSKPNTQEEGIQASDSSSRPVERTGQTSLRQTTIGPDPV